MTPVIEGAGVELHYVERGAGTPVLLVHGMADSAKGCEPLVGALSDAARVLAYDRRGYGESGAPDVYERTTVNEQAEDAAALLHSVGAESAVICAIDFGALVALDLLIRHPALVSAAVLVAPALFALVPEANEPLAEERLALEEAVREHGPEAAVEVWLSLHAPAAPARRIAAARAEHRAFFADLGGLSGWPVSRRELRSIAQPVVVVDREGAPLHELRAGEALTRLLSDGRRPGEDGVIGAVRDLLP
jgi:pimeloyl-ACP methyl ester carboxylesterase